MTLGQLIDMLHKANLQQPDASASVYINGRYVIDVEVDIISDIHNGNAINIVTKGGCND